MDSSDLRLSKLTSVKMTQSKRVANLDDEKVISLCIENEEVGESYLPGRFESKDEMISVVLSLSVVARGRKGFQDKTATKTENDLFVSIISQHMSSSKFLDSEKTLLNTFTY